MNNLLLKRYLAALLFILATITFSATAQQKVGRINGSVTDTDGRPLTGATVRLIALPDSSVSSRSGTDVRGRYTLGNITDGRYLIEATFVGYQKSRSAVFMVADGKIPLMPDLILSRQTGGTLQEVRILGLTEEEKEVKKVKNNIMPVTVITAKQIENRAGNLNEILARQAGVQIRQTGGAGSVSRISIRGLEGKRVQVFIDGNPLNTPDGSLGINDLPLQIIERIDIYKGAVPAWLGGDGLGSAVNVIVKHRDVSYVDATVSYQSYNTKNAGLILKKTFEKSGIELGAGIFDLTSDNDYKMESPYQPGLIIKRNHDYFHSLLGGASVRFHKLWFDELELEGAFINNSKQIQGIQQNIQQAHSSSKSGVIALNLRKDGLLGNKLSFHNNLILARFDARFTDTSSYSYNFDGSRTASLLGKGELGIGPNLSTNVQNELRERLNVNYTINDRFTLNLNSQFRYGTLNPKDDLANRYAKKNLFNYPGDLRTSITGLTLENHFLADRLLLSVAAKHYYSKVNGYNTNIYINGTPDKVNNTTNTLGYNAGMRFNFSNHLLLKVSHERGIRFPITTELFGDGVLITPAVFLKPEIAYNNNIGLVFDRTDDKQRRLQIEANAFYMNVEQLIQLAGNGLSLGYVNYAKARIIGAELDIKSDLTDHLYTGANVTVQKLTDQNKFTPGTVNVPNPTYGLTIPNTPLFFANWNLEYHKNNFLGKRTRTRFIYDGSYTHRYSYGFNISMYDQYFIPAFTLHTLSLEQAFADRKYTLTFEANNILDSRIINNYNQPLPGRTFRLRLRYLLLGKKLQGNAYSN